MQIEQLYDLEDSNNVVIIPRTGDIVIIINPQKGQEKLGIVTGHCIDGKVKILTKKREKKYKTTKECKNSQ